MEPYRDLFNIRILIVDHLVPEFYKINFNALKYETIS